MAGLGSGNSRKQILRDRYEIQQRLGKKAGRQTLLARDLKTEQLVVIKLLTFSSDFNWDDLKLFEREIETLKSLSHPAIPRYLDSFELDAPSGKGFALVQSYIKAKSLEEHLKAGRTFSEDEIKQLAKPLLEILIYLHGRQPPVIHRDIKPSNILLGDRSGNRVGRIYLVDFGSVQTLATQEGKTVTVVGTYGYMPPEQFGGRAVPASDLYSLGATLIALATRKHPADLPQKDMQIQFEQEARLSRSLVTWLHLMTAPSLAHRYSSVESALGELKELFFSKESEELYQIFFEESEETLLDRKRLSPLTTTQLIWISTWYGTGYGLVCGAISGIVFLPLAGIMPSAVLTAIIGYGLFGLPLGFCNGVLVGILTRLFFFPLKRPRLYRRIVITVSTLLGTAASLIVFRILGSWFPDLLSAGVLFYVAPALIIGLWMGWVGKLIAQWYEHRSRRERQK